MAQKKLGRPPSDNPLKARIFIRVDDETQDKIEKCKKALNLSTSDIVRKGIDKVYDDLKK